MSSYVSPSYVSPYEPKPADRSCHGLPGDGLPWESSSTFKPLPLKQEEATTNGNSLLDAINYTMAPSFHTISSVPSSPSTLKGSTPPPPQPSPMSGALAPPSNGIPAQPSKSKGKGE